MSQENRLLPLSSEPLDRPLRDLAQPAPFAPTGASNEPAHLREYLAVILKRKWLILSLVVVVTTLAAIQMYRMPSVYEAQTTIQIEQRRGGVLETGKGGNFVIRGSDPNYWNTQLKKLETQKLARQVILRLGLHNNPAFLGAPKGVSLVTSLRRVLGRGQAAAPAPAAAAGVPVLDDNALDAALDVEQLTPELAQKLEPYEDALRANLRVEPVERTNLINIHFQHTDADIAQRVANGIAIVFRENDLRDETAGAQKADELLGKQIVELQAQIEADEKARINFLRGAGAPLISDPEADLTRQRMKAYSAQLQEAEGARKTAEADYNAALKTRDTANIWSIPQVQGDKTVQRLREKMSDLNEKRAALLVKYTTEHPEVKKIDEQVKRLEAELQLTPNEIIAGLKNRLDMARQKEASLKSAYYGERGQAEAVGLSVQSLDDLKQRNETNKQLLQTYRQRQRELVVTANERSGGNVTQVEEARTPRTPIGPPRARNIVIALLLSLVAGIGLAFLLDYLDDTLKSVEDVDRHIHLPTLALIPAPREVRRLLGRSAPAPAAGPGVSTALTLIRDVRSPIAEAYRHLRTSLLLSSAGQPPKTVLVTSSQPSEGKTTTVVNIATMLAQTGADVLVLDCDLRRPRVHAQFGLANARGVTNYLSGEANVSDLIQTYEPLPNLKVITSGPVPPNAAELLGSDEMRKLLYVLSENFTHIIIDSPPAISFTDASILSTMTDGVMLVVHGGRSSRSVVRRAKQQLQDVGAHLFGIVLNNVKLESNDYYYYSSYYSGYYAEEEQPEGAAHAGAGANGNGQV
ncbi:MAG TPA: polysaccharide biosynthesis tyrosine autokinase [Pyrinomonadaceae bacterium]|nr:polysaccharide biosynthesis tyrosine autokinase [Pyrinomonadaceae bacterium]